MRKLIYVSERILNIQDLEKEIKNVALHFDILEKDILAKCFFLNL